MLYFKRKPLLVIIGCIIAIGSFAQTTSYQPQKIAPAALRSDFLLFRDTLQKVHAGLYRYKTKAAMDHVFDSCFATIQDSMTIPQFFALTSYVIAAIEDGHSNCKLPKQAMTDYINNVKVFPAMVMFIHNRAFVYCCKQNIALAKAELLSINNIPMGEIIQRLFAYTQTDGNIQSHKNWELPENFQLLYETLYGAKNNFDITYKTKTGELSTTTLQADFIKNILCPGPFTRPNKYLELSYKPGNIAVLTLRTFFDGFLQQTGENFSHFLDSSFNDINNKQIEKVVIDMRSNQGGNDGNGIILYSYLTQKPFLYYTSQQTVTDTLKESQNPDLGLQQPKPNSYKGKVYFLINGRSFSGVAEFSAVAKSNNRGIFIGEECGGGYYGNTSGNEDNVPLPNTQIIVRIPKIKYIMAVKKAKYKDRGVIPDFPVYQTISDVIDHTDSQLESALKIVSN